MSTNEHFLTSAFKRLIKNNRLGHGYLLFGEDASRRHELTRSLMGYLESGSWGKFQGTLVDGMTIAPRENGGIGIDEIRSAIAFLWEAPFTSSRRTVVIEDADVMASEAQQALLKTAEDPPRNGLLILSVKNPEALFPTLTSRLQKIYMPNTSSTYQVLSSKYGEEITKRAKEYLAEFLSANAWNKSKVLKALLDEEYSRLFDAFCDELFFELAKSPERNWKALRELLKRMTAMEQFTTNKKLQLEAVIPFLL